MDIVEKKLKIFLKGKKILGDREYSTAIVKILENHSKDILFSKGFPKYLKDENRKLKYELNNIKKNYEYILL